MGALSPRTRNAQVEMYQNGEVDYLVATDAIGMGLNLDIEHVAFSSLSKFDGRRMRELQPNELAQIAGRAGRFPDRRHLRRHRRRRRPLRTASSTPSPRIPSRRSRKLQWRNSRLEFGTLDRLIASLEMPPDGEHMVRAREADDLSALENTGRGRRSRRPRHRWPRPSAFFGMSAASPIFAASATRNTAQLLGTIFGYLHETRRRS